MFPETNRTTELDCPVCYAAHDQEIHDATVRIHGWFHRHVTHRLQEQEFFATATEEYADVA